MPKIVVVNLTDESVEQYEADGREYGRGLAVSLLEKYMPAKCPRLGAENAFIIVPGLFTGAPVPCATRATVVAGGGEGAGISVSSITGDMPQKLASLGIAALVIQGKSDTGDVVLYLDKEQVEFHSMPELRGRTCGEIVEVIREKWGEDCASAGCGPAADLRLPISSLFVTYPEGTPRFSCPRSSFGDVPASKGLRAVVVRSRKYFEAECDDRAALQKKGKDLAQYIVNDPICGGALPGLGSITLLHLLKNKERLPEVLTQEKKSDIKKREGAQGKINYCCAPMCVIGCLNRHSGGSGRIYSAPEESEVRSAVGECFGRYLTDGQADQCAALLARRGMELGINITEFVFTLALYLEATGEVPNLERIAALTEELGQGTVTGRVLGGGTAAVCRLFADQDRIQEKRTHPAVQKEKEYKVKLDRTVGGIEEKVSDFELLYREIFLFENLGICIFSSFALLNKAEPLQLLTELYAYKTGRRITVEEMLEYSAACLKREEELKIRMGKAAAVRSIPEFVKVLYRYFETSEK